MIKSLRLKENKKILPLIIFFIFIFYSIFFAILWQNFSGFFSKVLGRFFIATLLSLFLATLVLFFCRFLRLKIKIKERNSIPYFLAAAGFILYAAYGVLKFLRFEYPTWDFGLFDQALWTISHFKEARISLLGNHLLGDHFSPIFYLLAPLYWLFDHPLTLSIFEALVVSLGALPVYWLTRKKFPESLFPLALSLAYLFFIGNQYAIDFSFHPTTLFASLFLFAVYFLEEKKYFWHFLFLILSLMLREEVGFYVLLYGVFLLVHKKALGLSHILLGGVWFWLSQSYFMPHFGGAFASEILGSRYSQYSALGNSALAIVKMLILHPLYAFLLFFDKNEKILVFFSTFAGFGFLGLLTPSFWIFFLPMLALRFWSNGLYWQIEFHYGAPIVVFLVLSAISAMVYLKKISSFDWEFAVSVFLIINLLSTTFLLKTPLSRLIRLSFWQMPENAADIYESLRMIPKEASVSAQDPFVSHLAHREKIYLFPEAINKAQFVLVDLQKSTYPVTSWQYHQSLKELLQDESFGIKFNKKSLILFEKGAPKNVSLSKEVIEFFEEDLR